MRTILVGLVALLLVACAAARRPIDPVWGKVACAHCRMLVGDARFAAQALTVDGDRHYFDDLGCLVGWEREHADTAVSDRWVRLADADAWVPAADARFAEGFRTPMDSGWAGATQGATDWSGVRAAIDQRSRHAR
jgi:hypothetical protein